ncbi:saccharopine dehydrogenase NADP-binding domain-containing protein [Streptomyces rugosispiralis]|uniref:Saccharopine dehydrogenase NADP-binding domain-containing protein n=1 Tax=Streptomyces rugosispiralis TaxID=2967341 RepID=A0ABT1UNS5_9ACTN|nr:saccharopine dehydrogenase NADP-binding domain-containing protein [Streptomyces rugosispiralis]MCQ8186774.1 saccharopine dehydrogenase NADP-binding domain-containing protein [Streptomyces rugosispiralis]
MTQDRRNARMGEIWILGATGRIGRTVTAKLAARDADIVLVGRDGDRLRKTAADAGAPDAKVLISDSVEHMAAEIGSRRPAVVVNTLGDYARTATTLARACMPGGHYVDLAADLDALPRLLGLHGEAVEAASTLVTGAGFGVLATEAVVAELCRDRPAPVQVRVDALGSVAMAAGVVGEAFAAAMVDMVTSGGRRYQDGHLVRTRLGADLRNHTLPDGQTAKSAGAPSGELLAAQGASGARNVVVTTGLAPTSRIVRALLPAFAALLSIPRMRRLAVRQLARTAVKEAPRPRTHSWGHADITWPDGTHREGWLRAGDGMDYTADVLTETASRLARGEAPAGAYTPAAAFGPGLATAAGGTFILDQ